MAALRAALDDQDQKFGDKLKDQQKALSTKLDKVLAELKKAAASAVVPPPEEVATVAAPAKKKPRKKKTVPPPPVVEDSLFDDPPAPTESPVIAETAPVEKSPSASKEDLPTQATDPEHQDPAAPPKTVVRSDETTPEADAKSEDTPVIPEDPIDEETTTTVEKTSAEANPRADDVPPEPGLPTQVDEVANGETFDEPAPDEPALSADGMTRLTVTAYIGIGNRLFIRGNGPGLTPDEGIPLQFVSIGKWRWETDAAAAPFTATLWKNDEEECTSLGEIQLSPGAQLEKSANF